VIVVSVQNMTLMSKETIFILLGLGLMVFAFWFAIAYSDAPKVDCNTIVYSSNWTLAFLRNVTAICSNGG